MALYLKVIQNVYWFYFAGLRLREAQFKYSENLGKFGTKLLGMKTLPMVTMFYGALFESYSKCVLILFRGTSPTAKLNLIILKYLRNFVTKT